MDRGKKINWKNGSLSSAVSYLLYIVIWLVLDCETVHQLLEMALISYMVDFPLCMPSAYTLLGLCYVVSNVSLFRASYIRVTVYASCLLMLNNLVAFGMISLFDFLWSGTGDSALDELFNMKGAYTFAMIVTFLSSVHASTLYLQSYIKVRDEKQALEMALVKEKETALQPQLNSLKLQINPYSMFNNSNNLPELIEGDAELVGEFLNNLSKVYRYIIANLDRDLIPVADETRFLDSYLFLMEVRHGGGVIAKISPGVKEYKGFLPPAVLQLLAENAIKHNGFSMEHPLFISITSSEDYTTVHNLESPLLSRVESTGLGYKNVVERYALLCGKKAKIENTKNFYSVSLSTTKNIMTHENISS